MAKIISLILILFLTACIHKDNKQIDIPSVITKKEHPSYVIVKEDHDLYKIANDYDIRITDLLRANSLKAITKLRVGQKIYLPNNKYYTCLKGDSLTLIAEMFDVDLGVIAKANNIKFPYKVRPGQVIKIPSNKISVAEKEKLKKIDTSTYESIELAPIFIKQAEKDKIIDEELYKSKTTIKPMSLIREQVFGKKTYIWPVTGKIITKFGTASDGVRHDGINILCAEDTPIKAIADGTVVYAGNELRGYGNLVIIKHSDGTLSAYAHQKDIRVAKHQTIAQHETIGFVGSSGHVKQPQLHFAMRKGVKAVNPEKYLPKNKSLSK